ncbi:hypothetical protein PAXRUDRAFT_824895 [Paxillus rubicundulus Ve08.2h10]|uniref:Uncharacterized protein n=1 Tax=Paxillus rubicundulus Ve08.2h10 TaxID=930991 RepID=A0A0D0E182_9AGAM|nr:hypothetical protein PAXRUDRAFT_824895 [Paxillus rubicundulus Ve08.2h10]
MRPGLNHVQMLALPRLGHITGSFIGRNLRSVRNFLFRMNNLKLPSAWNLILSTQPPTSGPKMDLTWGVPCVLKGYGPSFTGYKLSFSTVLLVGCRISTYKNPIPANFGSISALYVLKLSIE